MSAKNTKVWRRRGRWALLIVLALIFFGFIYWTRSILLPFILAVVIAYILAPLVSRISGLRILGRAIPRWIAVIIIYISGFFIIYSFSIIIVPRFTDEFSKLAQEMPGFYRKASQVWIPKLNEKIQAFIEDITTPVYTEEDQTKKETEQEEVKPKEKAPPESAAPLEANEKSEAILNLSDLQPYPGSPASFDRKPPAAKDTAADFVEALEGYTIEVESAGEHRYQLKLLPSYASNRDNTSTGFSLDDTVKNSLDDLLRSGKRIMGDAISLTHGIVAKIVGSLMTLILTLMIAAFILIDTPRIMSFFRSLVPTGYRAEYDDILKGIDRGLGGVIRGQLIICLVNGTLTGIGLFILGVKYAIILALIATVFSLIPIFGTILSSIPSVGIGLTTSFTLGLLVLIWIIIIHLIEANILNPKIMGTAAHIHPVMVVFALVAGEYTYGLFGALLAVPVFSIFQTLFLYFREKAYPK